MKPYRTPSSPRLCVSRLLICAVGFLALTTFTASTAVADDWSVDGGDERQREIAARYKTMLEKTPTEGFAFNQLLRHVGSGPGLNRLIKEYKAKVERQPERLNYRLILGHLLKARGDYEEALVHYDLAVTQSPQSSLTWLSRGSAYLLLGKRAEATQDFEKALELEKSRERADEILRQLADLAFTQRDFENAEKYFERLLVRAPRDAHLRMEYAQVLMQHKRLETALEQYKVLVRLAGSDTRARAQALRDMAEVQEQMGEHDDALKTYRQAMSLVRGESWLQRELEGRIIGIYRRQDKLQEFVDTQTSGWRTGSYEQQIALADILDELGKADDALQLYRRASASNPRAVDARLKIIRLLERRGDDKALIAAFEALIRAVPTRHNYQFDLARHYFRLGNRTKAEQTLALIGRRFPRDGHVQVLLADVYMRYEMGEKAGAIYERLVRMDPRNEGYILSLGEHYYQNGERQKAIATWNRLLESDLSKADAHGRLGEVLVERGMLDLGIQHYVTAVELAPGKSELRRGLAMAYERGRRWESAVQEWTVLMNEGRSAHEVAQARGRIIEVYRRQNRLRAKMREFEADFAKIPANINSGYFLAESHVRLQELESAQKIYSRLVELELEAVNPPIEALLALERIYMQTGAYEEAIAVLQQLTELLPELAREYYHRMAELSLKLRANDDAIQFASLAINENPDDAAARARLGEVYKGMRQLEQAVRQYRIAVDLDPRGFGRYVELADLLRELGQLEEAERLYRAVARQSPDEALILVAARQAMQIVERDGRLEELESELVPLIYRSPVRPVYRKIAVEIYDRITAPLIVQQRYGSDGDRDRAVRILTDVAQRALPVLLDALQDTDISLRSLSVHMLGSLEIAGAAGPLARLIDDERDTLRVPAVVSAAQIGEERATQALIEAMNDSNAGIRDVSTWALGYVGGKASTSRLVTALADGQNKTQQTLAAISLGRVGTRVAVDVLVRELQPVDSNHFVDGRTTAMVWALGKAGDPRAVPTLVRLLNAGPDDLISMVVWSLAEIRGPQAVEALLATYWDTDVARRQHAATGLLRVASHRQANPDRMRVDDILRDLRHVDLRRGTVNIDALVAHLVHEARAVVPADATAFIDQHQELIVAAALARLSADPGRRELARVILNDLVDAQGRARLGVLTQVEPPDEQRAHQQAMTLRAIVTALHEPLLALAVHGELEPAAVGLLGVIGDRKDVSVVLGHTEHRDPTVRRWALIALSGFDVSDPALSKARVKALDDPDYAVRAAAATSLGQDFARTTQEAPAAVVNRLIELTGDRFTSVRLAAIQALGHSRAPAAVSSLTAIFEDVPNTLQIAILNALHQIDSPEARAFSDQHHRHQGVRHRQTP